MIQTNNTDAYLISLDKLINQLNTDEAAALEKLNAVDVILGEIESIRAQKRRAIDKLLKARIIEAVTYPSVIYLDKCEV